MCDVCRYVICPSGCPNTLPLVIVYYCDECGSEICWGDFYYRIADEIYCEDCIDGFRECAEFERW